MDNTGQNISGGPVAGPTSTDPNIKPVSDISDPDKNTVSNNNYNFSTLGLRFSTQITNGKKIVNSFLSALILLAGLGAGVLLATQPELFLKKAQPNPNVSTLACDEGTNCVDDALKAPLGSKPCLARSGVRQCCPIGQIIVNNTCMVPPSNCNVKQRCSLKSKTYGASACLGTEGSVYYCCKEGYRLNGFFNVCYKTPF